MREIRYNFKFEDGNTMDFAVDMDRVGNGSPPETDTLPPWTRLEFHQCANCPLATEDHPRCPAAADISSSVGNFSELDSCASVTVRVITPERTIEKNCDVQTGLSSLIGLILATSGCPHLSRLRNMANFHLPFASYEETLFRTVGAYLIKQYFRHREGLDPDLNLAGLDAQYQELATVNEGLIERIKAATEKDAGANAVVLYWSLSSIVTHSIQDQLMEEKSLFFPED